MLAETDRPASTTDADPLAAIAAAERAVATADDNQAALQRGAAKRQALMASAAAGAAAAVAAATTRPERDLIQRIYDAIPAVLTLSQTHSEADAADADDTDAKWDAWEAARKAVEDDARAVVALPPETAADALRRVRLYRNVLALTEGAPLGASNDDVFAEDLQVMGDGAIAALAALAQTTAPDASPWAKAKAAYDAALEESEAADAASKAAADALEASMPVPPVLQLGTGRWYFLEAHIERDLREPIPLNPRLTIEQAAEKLAALREFKPLYEAASERLGVERLEKAHDAALARQGHLAVDLINTPAPTPEAVLEKLRVLTFEFHGVDSEEGISELLTGTDPDQWAAIRVMQDLMRLTGSASPWSAVEPFDAEAFIATFEREPGCQITAAGPRWTRPDTETGPFAGSAEWAALTDWQKQAARDAAKRRERAANAEAA